MAKAPIEGGDILSIEEIVNFLRQQAHFRSSENDERSILRTAADYIIEESLRDREPS